MTDITLKGNLPAFMIGEFGDKGLIGNQSENYLKPLVEISDSGMVGAE
jgi:hypothetical protein